MWTTCATSRSVSRPSCTVRWDCKTWLQGLLYDASPQVRARAAKYIEAIQYLPYEADLKAALLRENDTKARAAMQQALDALAALRPWK